MEQSHKESKIKIRLIAADARGAIVSCLTSGKKQSKEFHTN